MWQVAMMDISWKAEISLQTLIQILLRLADYIHLNFSSAMDVSEVEDLWVELNIMEQTEQVW